MTIVPRVRLVAQAALEEAATAEPEVLAQVLMEPPIQVAVVVVAPFHPPAVTLAAQAAPVS